MIRSSGPDNSPSLLEKRALACTALGSVPADDPLVRNLVCALATGPVTDDGVVGGIVLEVYLPWYSSINDLPVAQGLV